MDMNLQQQLMMMQKSIEQKIDAASLEAHKDDVRVFRNVQASVAEDLDKQTKDIEALLFSIREGQSAMEKKIDKLETELEDVKKNNKKKISMLSLLILAVGIVNLVIQVMSFYCVIAITKVALGI